MYMCVSMYMYMSAERSSLAVCTYVTGLYKNVGALQTQTADSCGATYVSAPVTGEARSL